MIEEYKRRIKEVLDEDLPKKETIVVLAIMMKAAYNAGEARGLSGGS